MWEFITIFHDSFTSLPQKSRVVCQAFPSHQPVHAERKLIRSHSKLLHLSYHTVLNIVLWDNNDEAVWYCHWAATQQQQRMTWYEEQHVSVQMCMHVEHLSHVGWETPRLGAILALPRACETAERTWPGRPKHSLNNGTTGRQHRGHESRSISAYAQFVTNLL